MAIAYHRARGEGQRTRLIGRERGYHGVNFGGISVGGIAGNRKSFGTMVGGVDHLRHTHDLKKNAFSRGLPSTAPSSPTTSSGSSPCTTHRRSPR
jgi:beta-alanine--pyruvate transaminase